MKIKMKNASFVILLILSIVISANNCIAQELDANDNYVIEVENFD